MGFFTQIWDGLLEGLESILRTYESLLEPVAGSFAWGFAIILLTITVRLFLIPLMVRQTKSMRSVQKLQPELKKIQAKYKADRSMAKTDPERYKKLKDKQREAQMQLYQEHKVNPVGGCLPLILQMPIFFALFRLLQDDRVSELTGAPFFGISGLDLTAATGAGIGAFVLVALQVVSTFYSQKQMQARNATSSAGGEQAQAMKMMLYIMPVFLGYLSFTFPIGVVLYWVTTNFWTIGQQAFIFRSAERQEAKDDERPPLDDKGARSRNKPSPPKPQSSKTPSSKTPSPTKSSSKKKTPPAKKKRPDKPVKGRADQSAKIADSAKRQGNGSTNGSNGSGRKKKRRPPTVHGQENPKGNGTGRAADDTQKGKRP